MGDICCSFFSVFLLVSTTFTHSSLTRCVCLCQELKIEGEQTEVMEEDGLDLMLPTKKKKSKKVDFDEGEMLEKDDGETSSRRQRRATLEGDLCNAVFCVMRLQLWRTTRGRTTTASRSAPPRDQPGRAPKEITLMMR